MRLLAHLEDQTLVVCQRGGYGYEAKAALSVLSTESKWEAHRVSWVYRYSPGTLQGLSNVAIKLGAELVLDSQLLAERERLEKEFRHEEETRKNNRRLLCLDGSANPRVLNTPLPLG